MDEQLVQFIENYLSLARFRNVSEENPIKFEIQPDSANPTRRFIVVVSPVEPTFARLPYNVIWIPSDSNRPDFNQILKRVGHIAADIYNATWEVITAYEDLWIPEQFYQPVVENPRLHGIETDSDVTGPASSSEHGLVVLSADHPEARVVELADPRNTNARYPNFHTHPDYPRTMIWINDNDYALVSTSAPPQQGMMLFIVGRSNTNPNEWIAVWRFPTEDDLVVIDRSLLSITITGVSTMPEQSIQNYTVTALYADLRQEQLDLSTLDFFTVSDSGIANLDQNSGVLTVGNITSNRTLTLSAQYTEDGITVQDTHDVLVTTGLEITTLQIIGADTVDENTTEQYIVRAFFNDGSEQDVIAESIVSTATQHATISPTALLTANEVNGGDKNTVLQASYTHDGVTRTASKTVTIVDTDPLLNNIVILGPNTVAEGSTTTYSFKLVYSDGSEVLNVTPATFIQTTNAYSTLSGYDLIANQVDQNRQVRLEATYTEFGRTVSGFLNVTITDNLPVPVSAEIVGANSMPEQTSSNYVLRVTFDDNSTQDYTDANWSVVSGASFASVNATGTVTANDVSADQTITLSASREVEGVQFNNITKDVDILAEAPVPILLELSAPGGTNVNEGDTAVIEYVVTYSDNSQVNVKASPQLSVSFVGNARGSTFVGADGNDVLMGNVVGDQAITIRGTYTEGGVTVNDNLALGIVDADISPRWGYAPEQQNAAAYADSAFYNLLTNDLTGVSGESFNYQTPDTATYVFIMYPVSLGYLRTKIASQPGPGGFDGAGITTEASSFGEVKVNVGGNEYYVYRQTFPDTNSQNVTLTYGTPAYGSDQ